MNNRKGFSLIELVMTIIVIGIVAVPLGLLVSRHYASVFVSQDYHTAMNLARFEMERVKKMSYANVVTATTQRSGYDLITTVTFVQGTALTPESLKRVVIDVRKTGTVPIIYSLATYRARNVTYGL